MKRREAIKLLGLSALLLTRKGNADIPNRSEIKSFKSLARQKGIIFGTSVGKQFYRNAGYEALILRNCDSVTPENCMKWKGLIKGAQLYDFSELDRLYEYCLENEIELRGHALVFEKSMSAWINANHALLPIEIERFIRTVMARYSDVKSWDLFNEISSFEGLDGWLREDLLTKYLGRNYIKNLSSLAKSCSPNSELVVNEWIGSYPGTFFNKKRYSVLKMLENFKKMEIPIETLGIQSHLKFPSSDYDKKSWLAFCRECKDLGFGVRITELDIAQSEKQKINFSKSHVATNVQKYLEDTLSFGNVSAITCWGLASPYSFSMKSNAWDELTYSSAPFDGFLRLDILGCALVEALQNSPPFSK